jgi:serine/threonine protein kinase
LSKDFLIRTKKVQSVSREKDLLVNNRSCAFLPKIFHSFSDAENLYIVMEYIPNGTLAEFLQNQGHGLPKNMV